jgi:hypothetical protein
MIAVIKNFKAVIEARDISRMTKELYEFLHEPPYENTGMTRAEIKKEFEKIVSLHKEAIAQWAREEARKERHADYLKLKKEFEGGESDECRV